MPDYVTVPDVELFSVGMKWPAKHGDLTFRFDHVADAVAAQHDPHIIRPRLTIGHSDETFNPDGEHHNPFVEFGDGYPALGSIENMRVVNDGATCIGDFVEVPEWFAEVLPSAYPNRSIEGAWLNGSWDVETPGGKRYSFVLCACALLGIWGPAVQDLEDLRRFLTEGQGVVVAGTAPDGGQPVAAGMGDVSKPSALASIDKVQESFWAERNAEGPEGDRYWWWPREMFTEPNFLIVDDDEGNLFQVDFTSNEQQEVSFAEPFKVLQTFKRLASSATAAAAAAMSTTRPVATWATPEEAGRQATRKGGAAPSATTQGMDRDAYLRQQLGLPADATDEQVNEALANVECDNENTGGESASEETGTGEGTGESTEAGEGASEEENNETPPPPQTPPTTPPPVDPAAASTVSVDKATWEQTQRQARDGAAARAEQITEQRENLLSAAVAAGKIPPFRVDHYREMHKADASGTEELLERLESGLVPVSERGSSKDSGTGSDAEFAAVMASFGLPPRGNG